MDEDLILDSTELDSGGEDDEDIAYVKGTTIHKKIIPILLSPKVIFPFQVTNPVVSDPYLKRLFREAHEEHTVIGYLYHPEDAAEELPEIGQVGTAAIVPEFSETPEGSYLFQIIPLNRFFTTDYVNADPNDLTARVSYYWDQPEDDEIIKPLALEYQRIQNQINELIAPQISPRKISEIDPNDRHDLSLHAYTSFALHPELTEPEKLYLLWMYKLSDRLKFEIELMMKTLPGVRRAAGRMRPFKNN